MSTVVDNFEIWYLGGSGSFLGVNSEPFLVKRDSLLRVSREHPVINTAMMTMPAVNFFMGLFVIANYVTWWYGLSTVRPIYHIPAAR